MESVRRLRWCSASVLPADLAIAIPIAMNQISDYP